MTKYLIIHSDSDFQNELEERFESDGLEISKANSIKTGIDTIKSEDVDVAIIGDDFEDGSGLELKQAMNEISDIPTIMLSTHAETKGKILALEYGCDDYLVIPFDILELKSRIRAILRRYKGKAKVETSIDNYKIDLSGFTFNLIGRTVTYGEETINLTGIEYDLLFVLLYNKGKIFTREDLANLVWPNTENKKLRTVDVHIKRLREKLNTISGASNIETKWSEGYFIRDII